MPKWLALLLAVCAVVLTGAGVTYLRWRPLQSGAMLDTWHSRLCTTTACRALGAHPGNPFLDATVSTPRIRIQQP